VTDLHRQMAGCFVALDWFGRVSEFNRMRALRTGRTFSGTDAAAYSEALTWLDDRPVPCLSPAIAAVDAEVVEMEGGV
jgi:hypothetical protein